MDDLNDLYSMWVTPAEQKRREERRKQTKAYHKEYNRTHAQQIRYATYKRAARLVMVYESRYGVPRAHDPLLESGWKGHRYDSELQRLYYRSKRLVMRYEKDNPNVKGVKL